MALKIVRTSLLLVGGTLIFVIGILMGSTLFGIKEQQFIIYPLVSENVIVDETSQPPKKQMSTSYSSTHTKSQLWSMYLADENYYRIAGLLPCRTVEYTGGPKPHIMDSCDQSIIDEFSVEATIHAQKWIYEHQNPENIKFNHRLLYHRFKLLVDFVKSSSQSYLYGNCKFGTPDCLFLPISNCSIPYKEDGNRTIDIRANIDHWIKPIHPPIFQNRSFNWFRSQLLFYLMRYNPTTLTRVQHKIAEYFHPPSVNVHRPYVAVFVRRSDKVSTQEMAQAFSLEQYFNLFDADAHRANITNVYINSEDENVFNEFNQLNKNKNGYYKLMSINTTRNVNFASLVASSVGQRARIILEFLTDLYIEANADLHVGTLTSNWCRLVDEMKLALGKRIPYYTPENRFIIDM
ncbi:unnamed protein product [Rotaria socialis]|uniref:Alpha-(1,6)-fucosyltransferase N- and catalytic domain-containing protein n=1 Tax=Rotaria socialis TaxID=392032 RepID=A0A820T5Y6_9BILA|nr:unnamed protein product [Rotaria socialis]CAF4463564.1 unnamed protein product [Rotaria socialis]